MLDLIRHETLTCYNGVQGDGCGHCPACKPVSYTHLIGGGSNLLFKGDYAGTVLHSAIRGYEVVAENEQEIAVRAGAGEVWDDVVAYTVKNSWYGAENLSLIPGEVGDVYKRQVLFCTAVGFYGFAKLSLTDKSREINLFSLVPADCIGVLESDNIN